MKISFENYKLFKDKQGIELKPITIFVGANNSGKSSFSKLLLLLQNGFKNSFLPELLLNSQEVNLGYSPDVISYGSNKDYVIVHLNDKIKLKYIPYKFQSDIANERLQLNEISIDDKIVIYPETRNIYYVEENGKYVSDNPDQNNYKIIETAFKIKIIEVEFATIDLDENLTELERKKENIKNTIDELDETLKELESSPESELKELKRKECDSLKRSYAETIRLIENIKGNNKSLFIKKNVELYFIPNYNTEIDTPKPFNSECHSQKFEGSVSDLDFWLCNRLNKSECSINLDKEFYFNPVSTKSEVSSILNSDNVKEINKIVIDAFDNYLITICEFVKLDFSYSASIIRLRKRLIPFEDSVTKKYIDKYFDKQRLTSKESFNKIKSEIVGLLKLFDDEIETVDIKNIKGAAYEILLNNRNINDYGDGIKNVLSLILTIALNDNKTYLIEEPEVRLHPKSQSFLADFFSFQIYNNNFIIETHSEYFIRKLQLLVLQHKIKREDIGIYYFERHGEIREILISKNAAISDFGKGFFDEASNLLLNLILEQSKLI